MQCSSHPATFVKMLWTASLVGKAGIAPFSVTVKAPHAFAKRIAAFSFFSS